MKIGTWGKVVACICAITYFPLSFSAYLYKPSLRQFNQMPINIGHQRIHQNQKQLLYALKHLQGSKKLKVDNLYSIITAIGNKTKFQPFKKQQKVIEQSIEQFHKTPGYLRVFARIIEGTVRKNTAYFNGAIAEIQFALCKLRENKKILEFNRIITNEEGKLLTEIDIATEDQDGKITWHEIKFRKKLTEKKDVEFIKKQARIQKELAKAHGIEHEMIIVKDLNELISPRNKIIPEFNSQINGGESDRCTDCDPDPESGDFF